MTLQSLKVPNVHKRNLLHSLLNLFGKKPFIYLFLLNLVSNCTYSYTYHPFIGVLLMVCLSGSMALLEMLLFSFLNKVRPLGVVFLLAVAIIYTIIILADYFCLFNFQSTFDQDKLDILRETTPKESREFLQTYLSFGLVLGGLVCVLLMHIMLFLLSLFISKIKRVRFFFTLIPS